MRIVVAPDSFKGSMTAAQAAAAMTAGIRRALPDADVVAVPMADGGEGTTQSLVDATGGRLVPVTVTGPLGEPVEAYYGLLGDGVTAAMEMASASGLPLVPPARRNPLAATTYGTGELIKAALDAGCRNFIIGIGGSATNDGGAGMAAALGARLLTAGGAPIGPGGGSLADLDRIDASGLDPRLADCTITVACDVDNPLCGPRGASAVFGPQKGATAELVEELDRNLGHYADLLARDLGRDVREVPGAGAAGGLGAGMMAFLNATLKRGVEIVVAATGLADILAGADLCLTGEGGTDFQTAHGKTPMGVARAAKQHGVPVVCLSGGLGKGYERVYDVGIDAVLSMVPGPMALEDAMARGEELMAAATERLLRLWLAASGRKG